MGKDKISRCIKMAMIKAGITNDELAKVLSKTRATIQAYRRGDCGSIPKLTDVAEACGMTYEEMMKLADK